MVINDLEENVQKSLEYRLSHQTTKEIQLQLNQTP